MRTPLAKAPRCLLTGRATISGAKPAIRAGLQDALTNVPSGTGGAAVNAEVSKNRAKAVKEALVGAGVSADKVLLRKPAVTLGGESPEEARRVDIRVQMH